MYVSEMSDYPDDYVEHGNVERLQEKKLDWIRIPIVKQAVVRTI